MAEQIPDQQGRIAVVNVAGVAAGTDWNYVQEIRTRMWLKAVTATLITSVNIADRVPELVITQGGVEIIRITGSQLTAANTTFIYGWMEGERALAVTGQTSRVTALPRQLHLNNQAVISVTTVALDAVDQWVDIYLYFEEWIEPLA
ncbi:unnamed protein product [marine sediment metagenome]|uniref:IPT/TIG domain-containing protein n=1 Tax=marine sediment metagenome TaxID=412755 RepID=X1IMK2_9ZZZZ